MNERIKLLAEQAQKVAYYTDGGYTPIMTLDQEKFADLIVWECMKICEDVMKKDNSALACWSEIKGTFRS
jgi:hypothetical protein